MTILGDGAAPGCSGQSIDVALTVSGGREPYRWSLPNSSDRFSLSSAGGAEAHLLASALQVDDKSVTVQVLDGDGQSALRDVQISVEPTPQIETKSLPSVCPNEVYSVALRASDGDTAHYKWSTNLPEQTGIGVVGGNLQGHFAGAAAGETGVDVRISLDDGHCKATPVDARLVFEPATASACPEIAPEATISAASLPPPCAANPYTARLAVRRCPGHCPMQALALPQGITFDANSKTLGGVASASGTVTLQVQSAAQRIIETSYRFAPRDKCWFAYVSRESGSSRLHLFDPLLDNHRDFPDVDSARQVQDFQFSPDGRFLAYRAASSGEGAVLALVKIATWQQQVLAYAGVTHYGWSHDSSLLALGYGSDNAALLSGVDVAHATDGVAEPGTPPPIVFPTFDSVPTSMKSDPVWLGNAGPAFFTDLFGIYSILSSSTRTSTGFSLPSSDYQSLYQIPPSTRSTPHGLYVVPSSGYPIYYYPDDGSVAIQHGDVALSPSGDYAARVRQHSLQLFRAIDASFPDGTPYAQIAGCDALIGWAASPERIACVYKPAGKDNQIVIFEVTSGGALKRIGDVRGGFVYPESAYFERRRSFSPKGKYFAFTGDDVLYVARVDDGTPVADYRAAFASADQPPNNAFAELTFSNDERLLLQHRGARLSLFDLLDPEQHEQLLSEAMSPSLKCDEDFRNVTSGWCGSERPTAPFSVSPRSELAAAQLASGELQIYDLGFRPYNVISVKPGCGEGCIADHEYAFQP